MTGRRGGSGRGYSAPFRIPYPREPDERDSAEPKPVDPEPLRHRILIPPPAPFAGTEAPPTPPSSRVETHRSEPTSPIEAVAPDVREASRRETKAPFRWGPSIARDRCRICGLIIRPFWSVYSDNRNGGWVCLSCGRAEIERLTGLVYTTSRVRETSIVPEPSR